MVVRTFEPHYVPPPPSRRRRGWLLGFAALLALVVAGVGVLVAVWSGVTLSGDPTALAKLELQPFAGSLLHASAVGPDGQPIALSVKDGRITPLQQIAPGEQISVNVAIRRPGWLGWALGRVRV